MNTSYCFANHLQTTGLITTVFFVAGTQGLLLSLALFTKNKKRFRANPFLGLLVFISSLELLVHWAAQKTYFNTPGAIPFWLLQSYLVIPPSIWAFNKYARNERIDSKTLILVYVPALIEVASESVCYFSYLLFGNVLNLIENQLWFIFTEILPIIATVGVLAIEGRRWFSLRRNPAGKSLFTPQSIRQGCFLIIFSLIALLWALGEWVSPELYLYLNLVLTVFLFGLGYVAYFDLNFFLVPVHNENFSTYNDQAEFDNLHRAINENSLHKRPRLSLNELAQEVNLPPRYVSYLINEHRSTNFQFFINSYRVKETISKLHDPKHSNKTILALAHESGFNSKSTFNKVFKEQTGTTPSEYLRSYKN